MSSEHVDVLVVGAGLSGIGAACHLRTHCPGRTVAILESRDAIGGTWDLFRYPGVRSDSDMFTLGYAFRPWTEAEAIADGASILRYVRETAREHGVDRLVRFGHRVVAAQWSSTDARWTVTVRRAGGATVTLTCSFLSVCSGYYRYDQGYTPPLEGVDVFEGRVVHPQSWPADLDWAGARVVVIGSGATAVTLVPALAGQAAHVTMLQRSPTYISSVPGTDRVAEWLRRRLPGRLAYRAVRWKNVLYTTAVYQVSRRRPAAMKALLRRKAVQQLPEGFDVDTHLTPRYDPWDQRLCAAPDGDFFRALRSGSADIVTDRIVRFTREGILLASGRELAADLVVTATGLDLLTIGGMTLQVDGRTVDLSKTLAYKGMMLSGVPNFALTVGYTNASWTLKADLVGRYVCRLLQHMDARGYQTVVPVAPDGTDGALLAPLIGLTAGYVQRSADQLPRQGTATPWRLHQNYLRDVLLMRRGPVTDAVRFGHAGQPVEGAAVPV